MPARITITPDNLTASGTTSPHLKCVFNFDDLGDQLVDSRARLVVYDFEVYAASEMGKFEGIDPFVKDGAKVRSNLFGGPEDNPVDPPLKKGNGVLLKVDGVLRRTRNRKGWTFQPTNVETNKESVKTTIVVYAPNEFFDIVPSFNINIRGDDFQGNPIRLLVFRLVRFTGRFGDPHDLEVIACNFNPKHNPGAVGPTIGRGAVAFHVSSADPAHPSEIGKDGGLRPIAPPEPNARTITPDLTGVYEADPIDATGASRTDYSFDPPLILHINQAGNALAGWFSPPQDNLGAKPLAPPSIVPRQPGCFFADRAPDSQGWRCKFFLQPPGVGGPFRNEMDPDVKTTGFDTFRLVPVTGADADDAAVRVQMIFEEELTSGGAPHRTVLRLRRTQIGTRIPFMLLAMRLQDAPTKKEKEYVLDLIQEQVETLPTSFWDRLTDTLGAKLLPAVQEWLDGSKPSEKNAAMTKASDVLAQVIPPPTLASKDEIDARKRIVKARVRSLLEAIELKPEGSVAAKSVREWLQVMVEDKMDRLREKQPTTPTAVLYEQIDKSFQDMGIQPAGTFIYTIEFLSKGASTPGGIIVGAYAFDMTVKREIETVAGDGTKTRKLDDSPGWKDSTGKKLLGVILQAGAGASFSFKSLKVKGKGGSGVPGKVEISTFVDIATVDEFDGATFTINAVKIGTFNAVVLKGALVDSALLQFTLESGVTLDAVVDASFTLKPQFDWQKIAKTIADKKPVTKDKAIETSKEFLPEVALIQYIFSKGGVLFPTTELGKGQRPPPKFTEDRLRFRTSVTPFFDVDSAKLDDVNRGWLEVRMATDRALFEASTGAALCEGFASPEATEDHNQKLSELRAQAVKQAIADAFGSVLGVPIATVGKGELPARNVGLLLDPPEPPSAIAKMSAADQRRLQEEKWKEWPSWRKVDLTVDGVVVLRVMGRGARPD